MVRSEDVQQTRNIVTLKDIAERCGVAIVTVSCALRRDRRNVSQQTMERVIAVAEEMGYDPSIHYAARRLVHSRSQQRVLNEAIAYFFPQFTGDSSTHEVAYFHRIFRGILQVTSAEGFGLLTQQFSDVRRKLPPLIRRGDVDGVIALGKQESISPVLDGLRANPYFGTRPIVSLIEPLPGCSTVVTDDFSGGYQACAHLLDLGHRSLVHSCDENYPHQQRLAGYQAAYRERGLDDARYLHGITWHLSKNALGEQQLLGTLHAHPEITGILAGNDLIAQRMYSCLQQAGYRVPQDISLVGYDDSDAIPDEQGTNILTTVRLPLFEVGKEGALVMIKHLRGMLPDTVAITLPVELIERHTTARVHAE